MSGGSSAAKSTGQLPQWVRSEHGGLLDAAKEYAFGETGAYRPYDEPRIAGLTGREIEANSARQGMYEAGDPYGMQSGAGLGYAQSLAPGMMMEGFRTFDENEMNSRMSPFMEGVIQPQLREANISFDKRLNQSNADAIARGGSVGSYRRMLENAVLEGERAQTLSDIRGQGQQAAYQQAYTQFGDDRDARMQGIGSTVQAQESIAGSYNQLATEGLNRNIARINELERSGAINREERQRELDLAYGDFLEKRDHPMRLMNFYSAMLSGVPYDSISQRTTTPAQPGIPSQLASLGIGAASLQQAFGS